MRRFLDLFFLAAFINTGAAQINLTIQNTEIASGTDVVSVPIIIGEDQGLVSLQFTVFWDGDGLSYHSLTPVTTSGSGTLGPIPGPSPNNVDTLTYTWVDFGAYSFSAGDTVALLNFNVLGETGSYPVKFYLDDHPTYPVPPEAGDSQFNVVPITSLDGMVTVKSVVSTEPLISAEELTLFQNQPNPFKTNTLIGFNFPEAMKATFSIIDISGRTLYTITDNFIQGYNEIIIDRSDLSTTGLYYYRLDTPIHSLIKKMTLIE